MTGRALIAIAVLLCSTAALPTFAQTTSPVESEAPDAAAFIHKWDRNGKGLADLKAVLNAAMVKFELLDKAHKGRLTRQDLAHALTSQEFGAANPDSDATLGAEEWFDLVRRRFHAANPDNDGSISADELRTPQGQALLKLIQ